MNNAGHDSRVQARGRRTDDEFKARVNKQEPVKRDYEGYNAYSAKQSNLASSAFGDSPAVNQRKVSRPAQQKAVALREPKAAK